MSIKDLKIGDEIRIIALPEGSDNPNYTMDKGTKSCYKKLIERNRPVRIFEIDEHGQPWYEFRLKNKRLKPSYDYHFMAIFEKDNNWVKVKKRKKK